MLSRLVTAFLTWVALLLPVSMVFAERAPVTSLLELRQKSVVIQNWDLSCGAAALATLLRYQHGMMVSEKEVALGLITDSAYATNPQLLKNQQGFSLLDLKKYVDAIGLDGHGVGNLTIADLVKLAPLIVPVNLDGYNHFVVFRGSKGDRVLLADPAWGNRSIATNDFNKAWIQYAGLGKVGFAVKGDRATIPDNTLNATAMDFVMLK